MKLKACPMCGKEGTAVFMHSDTSLKKKIVCSVNRDGCGASSGYGADNEAAAALWHRRPEQKVAAWYVKGIGAFYIKYDSISEKDKQLGLVALGEIDV